MKHCKKEKLLLLLIMTMVGSITLTSCLDNRDFPIDGGGSDKDKNYAERLTSVVDPQGNALGTVTLRFYHDMPNVAYISVSHFQEMIYPGTTIQVQNLGNGKYALSNPFGTAEVDTEKDLFMSNDYEAFTNMMGMVQQGMPNTTYDALPIIRWKSLDTSPKQVDVTLDYGKYGIDIREDGANVYFPFATISDLYVDGYIHMSDFNGQAVMVSPNGAYSLDDGYPAFFISPLLKETRTDDMVDYSYKNLCFTLTNFFGYPGRTLLEKSMKEKGLDQALQDYSKAGQMTRELLKSKDMYDYFSGTATLSCLLFDGGHTYTDLTAINELDTLSSFMQKLKPIREAKLEEFYGYCPEYLSIKQAKDNDRALRKQLRELREEKIGKDVRYTKVGNTAYCHFDEFMCDDSGWRKYYKGEGPKPTIDQYPDDWLVILIDAIEKAQNDPEIKNFILDTSTNGGGSTDIVVFITSMFANKPDIYYENTLTGQKMKCSYEVDRNLDGKFDEKDKDVKLKMNIGVLISSCSFSCGNLLPALLKDYGICLLGKKSGGGSCCVLYNPSADGFGYRYSTHRGRLLNLKGENIDNGVEPDYSLETDEFFDIAKVGKLIEEFYTK
jgi:hypothetical protein